MFDCDFNNCIFYSDGRCTSLEDTHSRKTYLHCKYHEYKYTAELVNTPVTDLYSVAITLCNCFSDCKNCPCNIEGFWVVTEDQKWMLHNPCITNLYQLLKEKASEEIKPPVTMREFEAYGLDFDLAAELEYQTEIFADKRLI